MTNQKQKKEVATEASQSKVTQTSTNRRRGWLAPGVVQEANVQRDKRALIAYW